MRFRIGPLTTAGLAAVPDPCVSCRRWASDRTAPWLGELLPKPTTVAVVATEMTSDRDGRPGPTGMAGPVAGYALATGPADLPAMANFISGPLSDDALLLVTGRVFDLYSGQGVGQRLIHGLVKHVLRANIRALEAYGDSTPTGLGHSCLLPTQFLQAVGFSVVRRHPTHPRLRLDLRSIATWPSDVAQAADRLFGTLSDLSGRRPGKVPVGEGYPVTHRLRQSPR